MTRTVQVNATDLPRGQALSRIQEFIPYFDPAAGGLTKQDVIGCAIIKLAFERPDKGATVEPENWYMSELEALSLFLLAIPGDMQDAGFLPAIFVPRGSEHLLAERARDVYVSWRDTFISALRLDYDGKPTSSREELLATLFCKRIVPDITEEDEKKALRHALQRLAGWGARRGRRPGKGYLDVDDARNELWLDPPRRMYRKTDGSYTFEDRAVADKLRKVGLLPDRRPTRTDDSVEDDHETPLDARARIEAIRAVLSLRERRAFDLELQGVSREDAAQMMMIGVGTLNSMWTRIRAKARELDGDSLFPSTACP